MVLGVRPCHLKAMATSKCLEVLVDMVAVTRTRAPGDGLRLVLAASLPTRPTMATAVIKDRLYRLPFSAFHSSSCGSEYLCQC